MKIKENLAYCVAKEKNVVLPARKWLLYCRQGGEEIYDAFSNEGVEGYKMYIYIH